MAQAPETAGADERLPPGVRVEVRRRFDSRWSRGFEVAVDTGDGYEVRRLSDGHVLPVVFADEEIRKERRKGGMWWY